MKPDLNRPNVVSLLDRLPIGRLKFPDGRIIDPPVPFLRGDSFEDWIAREIYELGLEELSWEEMEKLRIAWRI